MMFGSNKEIRCSDDCANTYTIKETLVPYVSSGGLAVFLLYGLLSFQTFVYFTGGTWTRVFSVFLYATATIWLSVLIYKQGMQWWRPSILDRIVLIFWITCLGSIVFRLVPVKGSFEYLTYIPCMVYLPYLCGRLLDKKQLLVFIKVIIYLGLLMLILALIDRIYFAKPVSEKLRWPFLGYDHGRLMLGSLWTLTFLALVFSTHSLLKINKQQSKVKIFLGYFFYVLILAALVWSTARGWLLASVIGFILITLLLSNLSSWSRIYIFGSIIFFLSFFLFLSPLIEPHANPSNITYEATVEVQTNHVGGVAASKRVSLPPGCSSLLQMDSISARKLLYQEAVQIFLNHSIFGVGTANFGAYSCWRDAKSYPHSTILQSFAELGLVGGCLFLAVLLLGMFKLLQQVVKKKNRFDTEPYLFSLSCLIVFFVADQVYGNYLMATGTWLFLGVAAGADNRVLYINEPHD